MFWMPPICNRQHHTWNLSFWCNSDFQCNHIFRVLLFLRIWWTFCCNLEIGNSMFEFFSDWNQWGFTGGLTLALCVNNLLQPLFGFSDRFFSWYLQSYVFPYFLYHRIYDRNQIIFSRIIFASFFMSNSHWQCTENWCATDKLTF